MCFSSKQQKLLQHKFKQFGSQIFLINSQIILILFNECEGLNLRTACCSSYLHKSSQLKISSFYSTLIVRQTSETCGAEFQQKYFHSVEGAWIYETYGGIIFSCIRGQQTAVKIQLFADDVMIFTSRVIKDGGNSLTVGSREYNFTNTRF